VQGDAMAQYAAGASGMSATPAEGDEIEALKLAVWSNMALCHVKLGTSPDKAIELCDKVLAVDDKHSKAQFRKAQALAQLAHFDRSLALLGELLEVEPKDAAVRAEVRRVQQTKRAYDAAAKEKEKAAFADMFAKKR
jgi:tetratricopeptide (TPR) repeat protein